MTKEPRMARYPMGTLCWRSYRVVFGSVLTIFCCSLLFLHPAGAQIPPYPPSPVISDMTLNWSTHNREAPGSDNWPITWADNDHQYTAWGDGGGFGGTNSEGRVSLGVARVEGSGTSYNGTNVWGGISPENPAQFNGKSYGILSVGGILYMWATTETHPHTAEVTLAYSTDHGAHWTESSVKFFNSENMTIPTFLNFGKNYAGARDGYVYSYFIHSTLTTSSFGVSKPGRIYLSRVLNADILDKSKYEYFSGMSGNSPTWTSSLNSKKPVFEDPNGVGWNVSVSYNAGIGRYLLMTEHTKTFRGYLGLFDAPEPWGPWTTVHYTDNFGSGAIQKTAFYWNFSNKWLSSDGKDFVMVFTGIGENDSFNTVEGTFGLSEPDIISPDRPTGLKFSSP